MANYKTMNDLEDALKNHPCKEGKVVSCDDLETKHLGFKCVICGETFCIHLHNLKMTINQPKNKGTK